MPENTSQSFIYKSPRPVRLRSPQMSQARMGRSPRTSVGKGVCFLFNPRQQRGLFPSSPKRPCSDHVTLSRARWKSTQFSQVWQKRHCPLIDIFRSAQVQGKTEIKRRWRFEVKRQTEGLGTGPPPTLYDGGPQGGYGCACRPRIRVIFIFH